MKKFTLLFLAALFLAGPAWAQKDTRVIIMIAELEAKPPITHDEAQMLLNLMRTYIINAGVVRIKEKTDAVNPAAADPLAAGRAMGVDFVMTGSMGKVENEKVLVLSVVNAYSEEKTLGENFIITNIEKDSERAAKAIINAIKGFTEVTLVDIKRMIGSEEWENALKAITIYARRYPDRDRYEIDGLRDFASRALGDRHYKDSVRYCSNFFFEKARQSIKNAIALEPGNNAYYAYQNIIDYKEKEHQLNTEAIMLESVKNLIAEGKYKSAWDVLEKLSKDNQAAMQYRIIVRSELEVITYYDRARKLYAEKEYAQARVTISAVLQWKTDNPEYREFLARCERKEKEQAELNRMMNSYFAFAEDLSVYNMFMQPKPFSHNECVAYLNTDYSFIDREAFKSGAADYRTHTTLHGVEFSQFRHYEIPQFGDISPVVLLRGTVVGALYLGGNTREEESSLNSSRSFKTTTIFSSGFSGAVGPSISAFAVILGMGLDIETGYLMLSTSNDPLFTSGRRKSASSHYLQMGAGPGFWLCWLPLKDIQVFVRWRSINTHLYGSDNPNAEDKFRYLSIGLGYRFLQ